MGKKFFYIIIGVMAACTAANAQLKADFHAEESAVVYYEQGWDSAEAAASWTYVNNLGGTSSWQLAVTPQFSGTGQQQPFSSIEPESRSSLHIAYSSSQKDETATSPVLDIRAGSSVEYYLSLYAVWYFGADLKFYIIDAASGERTQLVSTFLWAQEHSYTGPNWEKFEFDLSAYSGRQCRFEFEYKGSDGENVYIDGFRLRQHDTSAESTVNIFTGQQVHFTDASTGNPTTWTWTFEGGQPQTSTEQNPVVTYSADGTYSVTLTVGNGTTTDTYTRKNYVRVSSQAPTALIGTPAEGYLSPYAYCFVPTGVPVHYRDLSSGQPTEWWWTFEGAQPATSAEQHPVVVYPEEGTYGLTLDVTNAAGTSHDFLSSQAIQAGGRQEVWNIQPEETGSDDFGAIALGFYGYYAGTNWMGMERFAERFHAPATEAEIDLVNAYFYSTSTVNPDAPITVSICRVGADGMPGDELASASVSAGNLAYDAREVVPTTFQFAAPVRVSEPFFVVIGGFPHDDNGTNADDIALFCMRRADGATNTVCHLLEEWDDHWQPTGNYQWYESDDPLSMAIAPRLRYVSTPDGIRPAQREAADNHALYDLQGRKVASHGAADHSRLPSGIYISNGRKVVVR